MKTSLGNTLIAMHKLLKKNRLSESHLMVLLLLKEKGPSLISPIHRALGFLPAQMTRNVRKLENDGLITRTINPTDMRSFVLEITKKGLALTAKLTSTEVT